MRVLLDWRLFPSVNGCGKWVNIESIGSYFESLADPRHTCNRKHSNHTVESGFGSCRLRRRSDQDVHELGRRYLGLAHESDYGHPAGFGEPDSPTLRNSWILDQKLPIFQRRCYVDYVYLHSTRVRDS